MLSAVPAHGAQHPPARFATAADSLRRLVESRVVPSIAVSVTGPDGITWEAAFGHADLERNVPATPVSSYPVASVSKSLTAIGVLRAAQDMRLDLDRPVRAYMGEDWVRVPDGDPDRLTTRALLRMWGGVPHLVHFHWKDLPDQDAALDVAARVAAFAPGTRFHYSNLSLGLAGDVLARVSGMSFGEAMAREVFEPLRMTSSAGRSNSLPAGRVVQTYGRAPFRRLDLDRLEPVGGAGMLTSAHDLGILARAVFFDPTHAFFTAASREAVINPGGFSYYTHGWWRLSDSAGRTIMVADGAAYGHAASLKVLPQEGIAVAVLTNGSADNGFTMGLADLLLAAAGFPQGSSAGEPPPEFVGRPLSGDTAWAGSWLGTVRTLSGPVTLRWTLEGQVAMATVGTAALERVTGAEATDGVLSTPVHGSLPEAVLGGRRATLRLDMHRSGGRATGYLSATLSDGGRPLLVVPFYAELSREGE